MTNRKNIIRRQCVDVSFPEGTDAFAIRDRLSWVCATRLLPAVERLLEESAPKDRVYHFEKLVIEGGALPEENWESLLVERVVSELLRHVSVTSSSFTPRQAQGYNQDRADGVLNTAREFSEREIIEQTVFYFLETGLLPWNASITSTEALNESLKELIKDRKATVALIKLLFSNQNALHRLIQQFSNASLDAIILQAGNLPEALLDDLKATLEALFQLTDVPALRQRQLRYTLLLKNIPINDSMDHEAYLASVINSIFREIAVQRLDQVFGPDLIAKPAVLSRELSQTVSSQEIKTAILSCLKHKIGGAGIPEALNNEMRRGENDKGSDKNIPSSNVGDIRAPKVDEVFVNNAGLVLLHPFLHSLFENTGYTAYTDNKVWISDETRERAVALTQYMVTGLESFPEFDLFLNKILTGFPINETLPTAIVLSDFEKQEADDVLTSVIKHWPALKNTTKEGLRSAFLNRDGKLFQDESGWNLKVDQKTIDILLNRLPWGLSMVRTPWMEKIMKVEWT